MYQENKEFNVYVIRRKTWKKIKRIRKKDAKRPIYRYATFVQNCKLEKELDEKAQAYWASITPILQEMQTRLLELGKPPYYQKTKENILYCINIFSIASKAQDELGGALKIAPGAKKEIVDAFNNDLIFGGRHNEDERRDDEYHGKVPYWNTTQKGEEITIDNIFFGPEIGLPRKPASYWLKLSKKKKVYMTILTKYENVGVLQKETEAWATEAIVKTGLHHFVRKAYDSFTFELEELLK